MLLVTPLSSFRQSSLLLHWPRNVRQYSRIPISLNRTQVPAKLYTKTSQPKREPPPMMAAYLSFITLPTADTEPALLVHFDDRSYIFGRLAESCQRACGQRGARIAKVREFFITGPTQWSSTGGLLGFALTRADQLQGRRAQRAELGHATDLETMNFHGAPNLMHSVASGRKFIFRTGGEININEFPALENLSSEPEFSDKQIQVWPIRLHKRPLSKKRNYDEANENAPAVTDKKFLQEVLDNMFKSNWTRDKLNEVALKDVKLPVNDIWVRDSETKSLVKYTGPLPDGTTPLPNPDLQVLTRAPWPQTQYPDIPSTTSKQVALSYLFKTYPQRGKFLPQKAKELGVKPGPLFAKLTKGESITLDNGTVITPEQVMLEQRPGRSIAIIDLPSEDYVDDFLSKKEWNSDDAASQLDLFVWILGTGVSTNKNWLKFVEDRPSSQHILASPDHSPNELAMASSAAFSSVLENAMPFAYRSPVQDLTILPQLSILNPENVPQTVPKLPDFVQLAKLDMKVKFRPEWVVEMEPRPPALSSELEEFAQKLEESQAVEKSLEHQHQAISKWQSTLHGPDSEIIALGTGSAAPSKYRNVSAMLLNTAERATYLFDCGEGTLGQMRRLFSPTELETVLKNLRVIWISHLHADHLLGIVGFLRAWYKVRHGSVKGRYTETLSSDSDLLATAQQSAENGNPPLILACDKDLARYLFDYSQVEDFGLSQCLICDVTPAYADYRTNKMLKESSVSIYPTNQVIPKQLYPSILGLSDINAAFVNHCRGAKAFSMMVPTENQDMKVSYSGDCRPSVTFGIIGRNSDVLIHEVTFGDDMLGEARAKSHSTVGEALLVAQSMAAKAVVMTHFSQRYPKTANTFTEENENVDLATMSEASINKRVHKAHRSLLKWSDEPGKECTSQELSARVTHESKATMKVCMAFDYMNIKVKDIAKMPAYSKLIGRLVDASTLSEVGYLPDDVDEFEKTRQHFHRKKQSEAASRSQSPKSRSAKVARA
jgi:ribonuclease Z